MHKTGRSYIVNPVYTNSIKKVSQKIKKEQKY